MIGPPPISYGLKYAFPLITTSNSGILRFPFAKERLRLEHVCTHVPWPGGRTGTTLQIKSKQRREIEARPDGWRAEDKMIIETASDDNPLRRGNNFGVRPLRRRWWTLNEDVPIGVDAVIG